jgi:peptidoglycan/LPS O-acetylase OafA/YrhL
VLALITAVWAVGNLAGDSLPTRFYANSIIFEFAAGCVIAHALRLKSVEAFVRATPMWPIALLGFAILLTVPAFVPTEAPQLFRYGLASMLVVFAAAAQDRYRKPIRETFVTKLGDASYSAYLLHKIVLVIVYTVVVAALGESLAAAFAVTMITVAATIVISLLSMKYFEKPTAALVRNLVRRRAPAAGH